MRKLSSSKIFDLDIYSKGGDLTVSEKKKIEDLNDLLTISEVNSVIRSYFKWSKVGSVRDIAKSKDIVTKKSYSSSGYTKKVYKIYGFGLNANLYSEGIMRSNWDLIIRISTRVNILPPSDLEQVLKLGLELEKYGGIELSF